MKKLCELQPGEQCCVVGTLFKAMPLQPSILREISEEVSPAALVRQPCPLTVGGRDVVPLHNTGAMATWALKPPSICPSAQPDPPASSEQIHPPR